MRILIIGDPESIFIKELVKSCLLPEHHVTVIKLCDDATADFYRTLGCEVISVKPSFLAKIPKIRAYALRALSLRHTGSNRYDVVHVMQMTQNAVNQVDFEGRTGSTIITYFGSDLLRADDDTLHAQEYALDKAAYITVPSNLMNERFHDVFGDKYDGRLRQLVLETNTLEKISRTLAGESSDAVSNSKKYFGIPHDTITIAIGYNAFPAQNHIPVITALAASELAKRGDIMLLLQLTYGDDAPAYVIEIEDALKKSGFEYKMFFDFMDSDESLRFRIASDIMIHAQPTDAFSASVREHLAAGSLVINPRRINYSEYKKAGIFYEEYDSAEELPAIIQSHIESGEIRTDNSDKINKLFPFDRYVSGWRSLYSDTLIFSASNKGNSAL